MGPNEISVPISFFIGGLTAIGAIASCVIWLFATFITRREAKKMEEAFDKLIVVLKELFDEKFSDIRKRLDKVEGGQPPVNAGNKE